jgi:endo-1,4-beta-xylanase
MTSTKRAGLRAALTLLAVLAGSAPAMATTSSPLARGLEAEAMQASARNARPFADGSASAGHAMALRVGGGLTRRLGLIAGAGLHVTAAAGCRAGLAVRMDGRPVARISVHGAGWRIYPVRSVFAAGSHRVTVAAVAARPRCRPLDVDRIDVIPATPTTLRLGAAVRWQEVNALPAYRSTFLSAYDSLTPENDLKMDHIEPQPGSYDFAAADGLIDLAASHGKAIRGHTLVFGSQLPGWVTHPLLPWTRDQLLAVMHDYIRTVVGRYRDRISTWDVVNEALNRDGTLRHTVWRDRIGPDYIDWAFRFAREAAPHARLFYNEIGLEWDSPKQPAALRLLADLRARGVPVDGVGLQNHTEVLGYPRQETLETDMRRFAALGLEVEITEMDVGVSDGPASGRQRSVLQTHAYRDAATACWDVAACSRVTTWGVADAVTWIGTPQAPLLFDTSYRLKAAYAAVSAALHRTRSAS